MVLAGCGDSEGLWDQGAENDCWWCNNQTSNQNNNTNGNNNPPDVERFLVREVATTDAYVFVPNADPTSSTVARVDARDLSVVPLRVGQGPTDVAARDIEGIGAVAYVLCEGNSTVAIVRADMPARTGTGLGDVRLFRLPAEVNRLTMAPDGRHAIAWIDPERSLENSPIASLQVMALIRLGDTPEEDKVFNLSVTRLIRDIEFTDNGELFILGREGVNRVRLSEITGDRLIPRLDLGLDAEIFPTDTFEMEVDKAGQFMVVRSQQAARLRVYELPDLVVDDPVAHEVTLPALTTDIDLLGGENPRVLVSMPGSQAVGLVDVGSVFSDPAYVPDVISVGLPLGLAQLTPDGSKVLLYSTQADIKDIAQLDLETGAVEVMGLRDTVYSLAVSPGSDKAITIHTASPAKDGTATDLFQQYDGLTLIDLATQYLRPVVLQGRPTDFVMTAAGDHTVLYVLLQANTVSASQGLMRINLDTFRSDFVSLPKEPNQIGRVGDKIFVSQVSDDGRLTFFDVETNEQRTVSGYELNAVID